MGQTTNVLGLALDISTTTMFRFPAIVAIAAVWATSATADQLDGLFHVPGISLRSSCDASSPPSCSLSNVDGSCCYESPGVSVPCHMCSWHSSGLPSRVLLPWCRLATDHASLSHVADARLQFWETHPADGPPDSWTIHGESLLRRFFRILTHARE